MISEVFNFGWDISRKLMLLKNDISSTQKYVIIETDQMRTQIFIGR